MFNSKSLIEINFALLALVESLFKVGLKRIVPLAIRIVGMLNERIF